MTHFTRREALGKLGKKIKTLRHFSGVPAETTGTVTGMYACGNSFGLDITWDLPGRARPLVDGFSKDEYEQFLQEIP